MSSIRSKSAKCTPVETALLAKAYLEHLAKIKELHEGLLVEQVVLHSVKDCQKVYGRIDDVLNSLENNTKKVMEQFPIYQQIEVIRLHNEPLAREINECTNLVKRMLNNENLTNEALTTLRGLGGRTEQVVENGDEREIFAVESLPLYHEFTILYRTKVMDGIKDTNLKILVDSCKEHRILLEEFVGNIDILEPLATSQYGTYKVTLLGVEPVDKTHYNDVELLKQAYVLWSESPKNGALGTFKACLETAILI